VNGNEAAAQGLRHPVASILLILAGFGLIVSLLWMVRLPANYQETATLALSARTAGQIVAQPVPDDPAPLYFLAVHGLEHWLPAKLTMLRLVSLACYLLTLPAVYFLGRWASGDERVGILGAALVGLSPFMLWYSNRGTVYALVALSGVVNQLFFVAILKQKQWAWPLYFVSAVLALGVHFFYLAVLLTQAIFVTVNVRVLPRRTLALFLACIIFLSAVVAGWWWYSPLHAFDWRQLPFTARPIPTNAFILVVQFVYGFQSVVTTTLLIALWPLVVVVALLAVQKYVRPTIAVQYLAFASFVPVLLVFVFSWVAKPLYLSSYFIVCLPAMMLLFSWVLVAFELEVLTWVRTVLLAVMLVMLAFQILHPDTALRGDYLGFAKPQTINLLCCQHK
jgi:uncharacterized membrane protein YidH (DUF202 family)